MLCRHTWYIRILACCAKSKALCARVHSLHYLIVLNSAYVHACYSVQEVTSEISHGKRMIEIYMYRRADQWCAICLFLKWIFPKLNSFKLYMWSEYWIIFLWYALMINQFYSITFQDKLVNSDCSYGYLSISNINNWF